MGSDEQKEPLNTGCGTVTRFRLGQRVRQVSTLREGRVEKIILSARSKTEYGIRMDASSGDLLWVSPRMIVDAADASPNPFYETEAPVSGSKSESQGSGKVSDGGAAASAAPPADNSAAERAFQIAILVRTLYRLLSEEN